MTFKPDIIIGHRASADRFLKKWPNVFYELPKLTNERPTPERKPPTIDKRMKRRIIDLNTGKVYKDIKDAANVFRIRPESITNSINNARTVRGGRFARIEANQSPEAVMRYWGTARKRRETIKQQLQPA